MLEIRKKVFSAGVTLSLANNAFLRRDDGNTVSDNIDLNLPSIVKAVNPTNPHDVTTKNFVDSSKTGVIMTGNLILSQVNISCED